MARIVDGNEGTYSTDHYPDWMKFRNAGCGWWGNGANGNWGSSWGGQGGGCYDQCYFSDGSAY